MSILKQIFVGQKFALMQEKTVLAWIFRKYRVTSSIAFEECRPLPEVILKSHNGFPLQLHQRQ